MQRTPELSHFVYYLIVRWAGISVAGIFVLGSWSVTRLLKSINNGNRFEIGFLPIFSLVAALFYLGIIVLSGFQDRYLIAPCLLFIIWLTSDRELSGKNSFGYFELILAAVPLVLMAWFSVTCVHDFMELKRAQKHAIDYLIQEKGVNPCNIDAGFEFGGYHCYDPSFQPRCGSSWWWVHKEDYVLTLGSLPGYNIVRTFPFTRCAGPPGAIHVLKPHPPQAQ